MHIPRHLNRKTILELIPMHSSKCKVAVVQATPEFFDSEKICAQVADKTRMVKSAHADLVLFPESFLPGYPRGLSFGATVGNRTDQGRELWQLYWEASLELGDDNYEELSKIAAREQIHLAIGVTEKDSRVGTLYCTMLVFAPDGTLIHHHRKLKPTGSERVIWGEGDGSSLKTVQTPLGQIGGLICWENMMPLPRTTLYQQGLDIYLAPTADARKSWSISMQHIAMEGRCYVLSANQYFTKKDYPDRFSKYLSADGRPISNGGSMIVSPMGEILAGPLYGEEGILYAEVDLAEVARSRFDFHASGHYARPDLFTLIQHTTDD